MTDAEKRLAEFYKEFAHVKETDRHYHNPWIPEMKSFLVESIQEARAEERARILAVIRKRCRLPIGDVVEFIDELEELTKKD